MATDAPGLEYLIRAVLDAKGFEDLQEKMRETTAAHKDAADAAGGFGAAMDGVASKLAVAAAEIGIATKAFEFFKDSLKAGIEAQKVLEQFAAMNVTLGQTTDKAREANQEWLESVELASDFTKSELVPNYMTLAAATGDVEKAQALLQIAAGAARRGMASLDEATTAMARAMLTDKGPVKAHSAFTVELKKLMDQGLHANEAFKVLSAQFGDAGASVNNAAAQVARAHVTWERFKEGVGALSISLVNLLQPAFFAIAKVVATVIGMFTQLGAEIGSLGNVFHSVMRAVVEALHGNFKVAGSYFLSAVNDAKAGFADAAKAGKEAEDKLLGVFKAGTAGLLNQEQVRDAAGKKGVESKTQALKKLEEEYTIALNLAKARSGTERVLLENEMAIYRRMADDKRLGTLKQSEAEARYFETKRKLEAMDLKEEQKFNDEITAIIDKSLHQQIELDKKKRAAIRAAEIQETKDAIRMARDRFNEAKKYDIAEMQAAIDALEVQRQAEIAAGRSTIEIDRAIYEEKKRLAQEEVALAQQVAGAVMSIAGDLFGQNKDMAIATALINTALAVVSALAQSQPYYLNIIEAAAALAAGMAQVSKIESTNPKSGGGGVGFDDPSNDFAAYVGGAKWARDMIDHFSTGAMAGFSSTIMNDNRQTVYNTSTRQGDRHSHYNIRTQGLIDSGSNVAMRQFTRKLQVYTNQLEAARTIR